MEMHRIIHLVLNTEERAMISFIDFLLTIRVDPSTADLRMKGMVVCFFWKRIKNVGANFCQVNRIMFFLHCIFLERLINQWWRGAEAIFSIRDMVAVIWGMVLVFLMSFVKVDLMIRMAEAIDWMMK